MEDTIRHTFHKKERLCGRTAIAELLAKGKHGNITGFRFCFKASDEQETGRMMVSVPKKLFKRAVKRNLLKRRIRESWRKQKHTLNQGCDILLTYSSKEVISYQEIYIAVGKIIERVNGSLKQKQSQD